VAFFIMTHYIVAIVDKHLFKYCSGTVSEGYC
jgi:hypothetical protein